MAGMGPPPKPPAVRQRRNRVATAAQLPADDEAAERDVEVPPLPTRRRWHQLTRDWWEDVWRSPMALEFVQADTHRLYILALLVDQFWKKPTSKLASEIRMQGQCFGLTPLDRRRLQWEVARGEEAERKRARPAPRPTIAPGTDPRDLLQVVS